MIFAKTKRSSVFVSRWGATQLSGVCLGHCTKKLVVLITAQQSYALVSICVYGMRSTGIVHLILYENILADGDMHCNGTGGTYLDMGTNVGYQVNKLYRPECTSPVQNIFDEFFKKRRSVCTIGIEPNPLLRTKLSSLRQRYLEQGINVTILFGFASTTSGFSLFYFNAKYKN